LKEIRLHRIFAKDSRTVIVACDHAGFMGPIQGLEQPGQLMDQLVESGVDAVLTTRGIAQRFSDRLGKLGLILRADGGSSMASPVMGTLRPLFSIEEACRLGADAVICMGMIGFPEEPSSLQNLAGFTADAGQWGMPVIAEMLVKPKEGERASVKEIGFAMRIGVELGADLIKASYAGPAEAYKTALASCYRPVVVLGGEKVKDEKEMLQNIAEALESGAAGVAIGRNVWQHANPAGVCRSLVELVHGSGRLEKALKEIKA
jgi:DhnA family fructose-bisphosphate aldolase class Ia